MLRVRKTTRKRSASDLVPCELIRLLGTRPDGQLAEQFQIDVTIVRRERLRRGVSRLGPNATWKRADIRLLGTMSDAALAARLGKSLNAIRRQRRKQDLPARGLPREKTRHRWTKRQLALLGKLSDQKIAEQVGLDQTTVCYKRALLGIAPLKKGRRGHPWTSRELALLGTLPDAELARKIGIHRRKVALKRRQLGIENPVERANVTRWTQERIAKLGQVPDADLANEMGLSRATVTAYRYRHGIRCQPTRRMTANKPGWSASQIDRLGKVPDPQIAAELGITRAAVAFMRQRLGISSHRDFQRDAQVSTVSFSTNRPRRQIRNSASNSAPSNRRSEVVKNRSRQTKKALAK